MSKFRDKAYLIKNAVLVLYALTAFFILCVGSYYSNPNSEDYSLSQTPHDMGIDLAVTNLLITYDGRYFTNILHSINPLAFYWFSGYKIVPIVGIFLFTAAFFFMCKPIVAKNKTSILLLFVAVVSGLYFQLTTSLPHLIYWMVSSFVYLWPWSFTFLFIGSFCRYELAKSHIAKFVWVALSMVSLFCAIGMNEMFLPLHTILLAVIIVRSWRFKKNLAEVLPIILLGATCILFFVTSPGISVRAADNRMDGYYYLYPHRLLESVIHYAMFTANLFTNPVLIVGALAISSLPINLVSSIEPFRLKNSVLIILALMLMSYLMLLPFYLPMQTEPGIPLRIYTTVTLLHILAFIWFVSALVVKILYNGTFSVKAFQAEVISLFLSVSFFALMLAANNNIKDIFTEWRSGVLSRFDAQMQHRFTQIQQAHKANNCYTTVVFDDNVIYPTSNYTTPDLSVNRSEPYWNEAWEAYFNVDEIKLASDSVSKFKYE